MSSSAMTPTDISGTTYSNPVTPIKSNQRIVDLDVLRGFALFGILLVNIFYFNAPDPYFGEYFDQFSDPINSSIYHAVLYLFTSRFYPIFSFLFGFGFFIQFNRLKQKGGAYSFFIRRLLILLLFGVAHVLFVWEEDILIFYALMGFILLPLAERSPRVVLIVASLAYFAPVVFDVIAVATQQVTETIPKLTSLPAYQEFFRTASYGQIMQLRLATYATKIFGFAGLISHFDRLAFFLIGLYAGKMRFFTRLSEDRRRWAYWCAVAFVIMVAGFLAQNTWLEKVSNSNKPSWVAFTETVWNLTRLAQVFVYLVGFLLLVNHRFFRGWLIVFAGPGRTSLTIYLMHTTIFSLLFYSFGLKQYGVWSPAQLLLAAIILFAVQIKLSNIWLHYMAYGPLEWVWRVLTYNKLLPIRKKTEIQTSRPL